MLFLPKTLVWIPSSEDVWRIAEVLEPAKKDQEIHVKDVESGERKTLSPNDPIHLCNSDLLQNGGYEIINDLTQLTHLHQPALLNFLEKRFQKDLIYTFTGPVLIALNPFKVIHELNSNDKIKEYLEAEYQELMSPEKISPHVFAFASKAFYKMLNLKKSQTILISGESGAGKTESTKLVLKFLALAGSSKRETTFSITEDKIIQSSPLLETIGNAKTLRNDNSSRFGKFMEIQFSVDNSLSSARLVGTRIFTYLLETVRVCAQTEGERNYHIFYQLCAAAKHCSGESDGKYLFPSILDLQGNNFETVQYNFSDFREAEYYHFLGMSSYMELSHSNDLEEFEKTILAMQVVGLSTEEQMNIFSVFGAILYLGNIEFEEVPARCEETRIIRDPSLLPNDPFKMASKLLAIEEGLLEKALLKRTIVVNKENICIPLKKREARDSRCALAKILYKSTFDYIVEKTNSSIGYLPDVELSCNVLDIFGFESFHINSFEQLCINFTNEKLQEIFNLFIFEYEKELYLKEGVNFCFEDFPSNRECLKLLDGNGGIFDFLDEECLVPRGSDQAFCEKVKSRHRENQFFKIVKLRQECFVIRHFAGPVIYTVNEFLQKNRDQRSQDINDLLLESSCSFISNLFRRYGYEASTSPENKTTNKKQKSVSANFRAQLNGLSFTINKTEPHFIRCIKPNSKNVASLFDRKEVNEQLKNGGVLQAIEISRAGYPIRLTFEEALESYSCLLNCTIRKALINLEGWREKVKLVFEFLDKQLKFPQLDSAAPSWAIGLTMIFLKHSVYHILMTEKDNVRFNSSCKIQAFHKRRKAQKILVLLKKNIIMLQSCARVSLARKILKDYRKQDAIVTIQSQIRKHILLERYKRIRHSLLYVKGKMRYLFLKKLKCETGRHLAAKTIQSRWRLHLSHNSDREKQETSGLNPKLRENAKPSIDKVNVALKEITIRKESEHQTQLKKDSKSSEIHVTLSGNKTKDDINELSPEKAHRPCGEHTNVENKAFETYVSEYREEIRRKNKEIEKLSVKLNKCKKKLCNFKVENAGNNKSKNVIHDSFRSLTKNLYSSPHRTSDSGITYDILILGDSNSKSNELMDELMRKFPYNGTDICNNKKQLISGCILTLGKVSILDSTFKLGHVELSRFVPRELQRNWLLNSKVLLIIYSVCDESSYEYAINQLEIVQDHPCRICFANLLSKPDGNIINFFVNAPKKLVTSENLVFLEGKTLCGFVGLFLRLLRPTLSPSISATEGLKKDAKEPSKIFPSGNILTNISRYVKHRELSKNSIFTPFKKVKGKSVAVTVLVFGNNIRNAPYYDVLAVGYKDGSVVVYRFEHSFEEKEMKSGKEEMHSFAERVPNGSPCLTLSSHYKAVTDMVFSTNDRKLVTSSLDNSVRCWDLSTGATEKIFWDISPCVCVAFMPLDNQNLVLANALSVVRIVSCENGSTLQKIKLGSNVTGIEFDDTGFHCFFSTQNGYIYISRSDDKGSLNSVSRTWISEFSITSLTFVPSKKSRDIPCVLVSCCDSTAYILDCIYSPESGILERLIPRSRLPTEQTSMPLRSCAVEYLTGRFAILPSENGKIFVYPIDSRNDDPRTPIPLKSSILPEQHDTAVLSVSVNSMGTLLVSGDNSGKIVFWIKNMN